MTASSAIREREGPGGIEVLTPEGKWAVIVHTAAQRWHLDHSAARENFGRGKRRAFFEHLEAVRKVADAYGHAPLGFYEDRRLLWQEWELEVIEGRWLTELIVG